MWTAKGQTPLTDGEKALERTRLSVLCVESLSFVRKRRGELGIAG